MSDVAPSSVPAGAAADAAAIERLWTYEDLAIRYGVSVRQVHRIVKGLGLKPVKLAGRTVRFRPCSVYAAEERAERGVSEGRMVRRRGGGWVRE